MKRGHAVIRAHGGCYTFNTFSPSHFCTHERNLSWVKTRSLCSSLTCQLTSRSRQRSFRVVNELTALFKRRRRRRRQTGEWIYVKLSCASLSPVAQKVEALNSGWISTLLVNNAVLGCQSGRGGGGGGGGRVVGLEGGCFSLRTAGAFSSPWHKERLGHGCVFAQHGGINKDGTV